ncbi:MAG: diaminopropionate ammonia-lyase [Deltaproteobacteria bacterium]|nr:diaminopropionate ammonia-lyase [Deltaproteobacteria bacterium]
MKIFLNPSPSKVRTLSQEERGEILRFHQLLPGYRPSPLISLDTLAAELGVERLYIKDEGGRFGLKAFKALGASYAVYRILKDLSGGSLAPEEFLTARGLSLAEGFSFCCATDGNHGRAVAWIARLLERPAMVFVPQGTVSARIEAIESEGAEVIVVRGGYDDAVKRAAEYGKGQNVVVVADVAYSGYMAIPSYIQSGYLTIFTEASIQLIERGEEPPDIIFIQAGVGALASAAALFSPEPEKGPDLVSVEPTASACLLHSAEKGDDMPHSVEPGGKTIMAGLNCETPSLTAWPLIRDRFTAFVSIEDTLAMEAMRLMARVGVVAGESGAAGLAAVLALRRERRNELITPERKVLLINTESDTDPEGYEKIVGERA